MIKETFEFVIGKRVEVQLGDFHDDMEPNEMNNAQTNLGLICQHIQIYALAEYTSKELQEADKEAWRNWAFDEHATVLRDKFHDIHAHFNGWIKTKM